MKKLTAVAAALAASTTMASAGGLDRSGQSVGVIFEEGDYIQLSFGSVNPSVSGTILGVDTTNVAPSYQQYSFGYRNQLNDSLAIGLIFDQPFGADVNYPASALVGTRAEFSSSAVTAMAQYRVNKNVSIYAGVKSQSVSMEVAIPGGGALNYVGSGDSTQAFGYVLGAAYEIPEIALRAALTYHSATNYDIATAETSPLVAGGAVQNSVTSITLPQAVNLDFQTGIAADTLLTAGIRWANWTQTVIAPNMYSVTLGQGNLLDYSQDSYTYSLGVGRRFTDNFAASLTVGHEAKQGGIAGNLSPTDGNTSVTLGGSYTMDGVEISGGVRYVMLGDATSAGGGAAARGTFTGNSAIGLGLSVGMAF